MRRLTLLLVFLVACAPHPLRPSTLPLTVVEVAPPETRASDDRVEPVRDDPACEPPRDGPSIVR